MLRPVLVVDDDDAIGRLIAATLKEHGFAVVTIYDGPDVLDAVKAVRPAVVILDGRSRDSIRRLRDDPRTLDIPILLIVSDPGPHSADAVLWKPFDPNDLVSAVGLLTA